MELSKEKTTAIKGIVILMMIFGHLFRNKILSNHIYSIDDIWNYNGKNLVEYLSYAMDPVHFYIILSGFGLYKVYENGMLNWKQRLKKVIRIYIVCWIVLLIFVPLGRCENPEAFKMDFVHVVGNLLCADHLYNSSWWFLFPYVLLAVFSPIIIRFFNKRPYAWMGGAFFTYCITGIIISQSLKCSFFYLFFPLNQLVLFLYFQFSFSLGVMLGKFHLPLDKIPNVVCVIVICIAALFEILFHVTVSHPIYSLIIIISLLAYYRVIHQKSCCVLESIPCQCG